MADEPNQAPDPDEGLTARERRAIRVREQRRADAPKKAAKTIAIFVVIALLLAGGVWAYTKIPKGRGNGHEHYVYRMFVEGQEISFSHPDYDFSSTNYINGHLHLPAQGSGEATNAQYVIHSEGEGKRGITLARFFETLNIQASSGKVRLNPVHDGGRVVENDANNVWQLWVDDCRDDVEGNFHKEGKLFNFAPLPHDRMLLTFAPKNATAESLSAETAKLPTFQQLDEQLHETCTK